MAPSGPMAAPFGPPGGGEDGFLAAGRDAGEAAGGDFGDEQVAVRELERAFGKAEAGSDDAKIHGEPREGSGRILPDAGALYASVAQCRRCPGMGCAPVLSAANGQAGARIMFVGEAPGRFGAGRTGVPFQGDVAGRRFEMLLGEAGLCRDEVYVTNAVLCLPLDSAGRNRTPLGREVRACSGWLEQTIGAVEPPLVVAMGAVALAALALIEPHGVVVSNAGGTPTWWFGRQLAAVYHPGARAAVHRPWEAQLEDWRALGEAVRRLPRASVCCAHEF